MWQHIGITLENCWNLLKLNNHDHDPQDMYKPNRSACINLPKYMYKNVHGSFVHNDQKLETNQMSTNRRMDK
jgi:hypothetical protein